jgi:hypothetical protein
MTRVLGWEWLGLVVSLISLYLPLPSCLRLSFVLVLFLSFQVIFVVML